MLGTMSAVRRGCCPAPRTARIGVLLLAPAGLGIGHLLAYTLAGAQTESHLTATGHGYLPLGLRVAVLVGLVGAAVAVVAGVRRARSRSDGSPSFIPTTVRLAGAQTGGFVALEVAERAVASAPLGGLGSLLVMGLVVQVLVAAALALLLVGLDRAGELLASPRRHAAPRPAHRLATRSTRPVGVVRSRSWSERAPPVGLLA